MKVLAAVCAAIIVVVLVFVLVPFRSKDIKDRIEKDFRRYVEGDIKPGKHAEIIMQAKEKLAALQLQCDSLKQKLDYHEAALKARMELLEKDQSQELLIGDNPKVSRNEVIADINKRVVICKKLRTQFEAAIEDYKEIKESFYGPLVSPEMALKVAKTKESCEKLLASLESDDFSSEENPYLNEIRKRLKIGDIGPISLANGDMEFIDYGTPKASISMSGAQEYWQRYLSPPPTAPASSVSSE